MDENNTEAFRIFRMQTGEDVVALSSIPSEEDVMVTLVEPMLVKKIKVQGEWMTTLVPWLPIDIIEFNVAVLSKHDILMVMAPTESFIEEYKRAVDHFLSMFNGEQTAEQYYDKVLENFDSTETKH